MRRYIEADSSYCTLFNSFYLDRGITMLHSLIKNSGDIRIYVLTMDDNAFDVLAKRSLNKVILIRHEDFATEELLELQKQRTVAEYCWTCTSRLIEYVFKNYNEYLCTYIDADLYFYQNPYCLVEEMVQAECVVQIVEHKFGKGIFANHMRKYSGVYCVQFNTFENVEEARKILREWIRQCTEVCNSEQDGETLGDQKYLEEWPDKYKCVHVLENEGGGLAPWNIHIYRGRGYDTGSALEIENKYNGKSYPLIFYHFHGLKLEESGKADIGVFTRNFGIDKKLVSTIYQPYIKRLWKERKKLGNDFKSSENKKKRNNVKKKISKKIFSDNLGERLYCRIRTIFMRVRKNKDLISLH